MNTISASSPLGKTTFTALHKAMSAYYPISGQTWREFTDICELVSIEKNEFLYPVGQVPNSFAFVYSGLFRLFIADEKGNEYNKMFFDENTFPGSMVALLKNGPSRFAIEALEASKVITINFNGFRRLLASREDLKMFHIHYLEQNWLIAKEAREVALVQEEAQARYLRFLDEYQQLELRLPQYHIASHLGITPTQLSRIRKQLAGE
ncbi:Crp/Fnr family transcriptional regulator [Thalassomonas viridans]|uniref:Crp/Fnr family transcriptional regulator n=1 Tax=Thalassomonas viridans TaxID=137584 RepID=A0AAE9Z172_9GAMM|nr:Crp/Fnr family transcriptional regulator [Thalassomonas viridans]WDE03347.1 Crp/Fnr family transcriptional regulator [Thalassomonas viridans]